MGRSRVLSTFLSISESHMSLMVHPAPLMIIAPVAMRLRIYGSGNSPAQDAIPMDQPHGQNKSHEPMGLSNRTNRKNG